MVVKNTLFLFECKSILKRKEMFFTSCTGCCKSEKEVLLNINILETPTSLFNEHTVLAYLTVSCIQNLLSLRLIN